MERSEEKKGWAVITGASSGIGLELARQFAKNGFNILITAEDEGINDAAKNLAQYGGEVISTKFDLRYEQEVEDLFQRIRQLPSIDAVAINAGVGVGGASFDKTDLKQELDLLRLNIVSVVHLTKRLVREMLLAGHGRILFTSSADAFTPGPFENVYSASKAFVQSFAEGLRAETHDRGITVTTLQPGPTETNFFHRAGMDDTKVAQDKKNDPAKVAEQGYKALMDGDAHVLAGSLKNKVQGNLNKVVPQKVAAKIHENKTKPHSLKNK